LFCYNLITYIPNCQCYLQWLFFIPRWFDLALIFPLYLLLHFYPFKSAAACFQVPLCLLNLLIDIIVVRFCRCAIFGADDNFSVKHDFYARFRLTTMWTACPVCHLISHLLKNIYLALHHLVINIAECLKCRESE